MAVRGSDSVIGDIHRGDAGVGKRGPPLPALRRDDAHAIRDAVLDVQVVKVEPGDAEQSAGSANFESGPTQVCVKTHQ